MHQDHVHERLATGDYQEPGHGGNEETFGFWRKTDNFGRGSRTTSAFF
jgi:hypothetical protein